MLLIDLAHQTAEKKSATRRSESVKKRLNQKIIQRILKVSGHFCRVNEDRQFTADETGEQGKERQRQAHQGSGQRAHYTQVPRGPVYNETEKKQNTEEWQFNMLSTPLKLPTEKKRKKNKIRDQQW